MCVCDWSFTTKSLYVIKKHHRCLFLSYEDVCFTTYQMFVPFLLLKICIVLYKYRRYMWVSEHCSTDILKTKYMHMILWKNKLLFTCSFFIVDKLVSLSKKRLCLFLLSFMKYIKCVIFFNFGMVSQSVAVVLRINWLKRLS